MSTAYPGSNSSSDQPDGPPSPYDQYPVQPQGHGQSAQSFQPDNTAQKPHSYYPHAGQGASFPGQQMQQHYERQSQTPYAQLPQQPYTQQSQSPYGQQTQQLPPPSGQGNFTASPYGSGALYQQSTQQPEYLYQPGASTPYAQAAPKKNNHVLIAVLAAIGLVLALGLLAAVFLFISRSDAGTHTAVTVTSTPPQAAEPNGSAAAPTSTPGNAASGTNEDKDAAVESAQFYVDSTAVSPKLLMILLTGEEYGGDFTEETAQYAIDHLHVDWKEEALESAKDFKSFGEPTDTQVLYHLEEALGFNQEEIDYAMSNL